MDFRPELIPHIRKLELHAKRTVLSHLMAGNWMSKIRGHGIEFTGYRQYSSGDDANLIDWKASVRSRRLLVRELTEEKSLNVYFFYDVSDTMLTGTTDKVKAEYAAELVCSLSYAALRSGESVGMAMWSDHIKRFIGLSQGMGQHAVLMKALANPANYGGAKDISRVGAEMMGIMQESGLIIVVSDCIGFDEKWAHILRVFAHRHDLIVICVRDQRDRRLPAEGEYVLSDPSTGQKIVVDASDYAAPYKEYVEKEEALLRHTLAAGRADLLLLETTDDYSHSLTKFLIMHNKRSGD